jgi:hypothetical protein
VTSDELRRASASAIAFLRLPRQRLTAIPTTTTEISILMATVVMGWSLIGDEPDHIGPGRGGHLWRGEDVLDLELWSPATKDPHALEVLHHLMACGHVVTVTCGRPEGQDRFTIQVDAHPRCEAPTLSLAICTAALRAVGLLVDESALRVAG